MDIHLSKKEVKRLKFIKSGHCDFLEYNPISDAVQKYGLVRLEDNGIPILDVNGYETGEYESTNRPILTDKGEFYLRYYENVRIKTVRTFVFAIIIAIISSIITALITTIITNTC